MLYIRHIKFECNKNIKSFSDKDNDRTRQVLIQKADMIKSMDTVISDMCPAVRHMFNLQPL